MNLINALKEFVKFLDINLKNYDNKAPTYLIITKKCFFLKLLKLEN
jgi:hypothetical protein